jgi:hypothetical protein
MRDWEKRRVSRSRPILLAGFAGPAVHHRFDGAGVFLGIAVFAHRRRGVHDAASLLFDVDGGFPDVGGGGSAG